MAYDARCYDLAALFLSDEPTIDNETHRDALAQTIQTAIEDYIQFERGLEQTRRELNDQTCGSHPCPPL